MLKPDTHCPNYTAIASGIIPETCAKCPYFNKISNIMHIGRIALIGIAVMFVLTTGYFYG